MKILVIEDETAISAFIKSSLESKLYVVDTASDGERGAFLGRIGDYDLIILDYLMPKKNGLEVVKEIRLQRQTPILMLTVYGDFDCKKQAFDLGVDDFLTKPFLLEELFLRIEALLRRPVRTAPEILKLEALTMDLRRQVVKRHGKTINLTRKEYIILEYLMRHRGEVNSREAIMENVWDVNFDSLSNTLDTHILNLRNKLRQKGKGELIHTFSGRGYKMDLKKL